MLPSRRYLARSWCTDTSWVSAALRAPCFAVIEVLAGLFSLWRPNVICYVLNQPWNVVQELLGGEHLIGLDRQQATQSLQPPDGNKDVFSADALGDLITKPRAVRSGTETSI